MAVGFLISVSWGEARRVDLGGTPWKVGSVTILSSGCSLLSFIFNSNGPIIGRSGPPFLGVRPSFVRCFVSTPALYLEKQRHAAKVHIRRGTGGEKKDVCYAVFCGKRFGHTQSQSLEIGRRKGT